MTDRTWYLIVVAVFGVILAVVVFGFAVSVAAQVEEAHPVPVTVDIETIVRGDSGYTENVLMLTPADVEAEPGWICDLVGFGDNGDSTHDGTNAHISSNGDSVSILDWERVANTRTEATNGTLTLGANITIAIQVGEDGVASGGLEIQFTCNPPGQPPPTTTTTASPEPSTTTTTVPPTTDTTEPPTVTTSSSIPIGVPSGVGPVGSCADGACEGFRLTPLETWLLLPAMLALSVGLAGALTIAVWRSDG